MFYWTSVILLIAILLAGFQFGSYWLEGGVNVVSKPSDKPLSEVFHRRGRPLSDQPLYWFDKWMYWRAIRKFPTPKHCLKKSGQADLDVNQFNWKSMRTEHQAQVCLHHAYSLIGQPEQVVNWLHEQKFDVRYYENSSFQMPVIEAYWRELANNSLSPFSHFSFWILGEISPFVTSGIRVQLQLDESGEFVRKSEIRFGTAF